jgi:hypothetical protein
LRKFLTDHTKWAVDFVKRQLRAIKRKSDEPFTDVAEFEVPHPQFRRFLCERFRGYFTLASSPAACMVAPYLGLLHSPAAAKLALGTLRKTPWDFAFAGERLLPWDRLVGICQKRELALPPHVTQASVEGFQHDIAARITAWGASTFVLDEPLYPLITAGVLFGLPHGPFAPRRRGGGEDGDEDQDEEEVKVWATTPVLYRAAHSLVAGLGGNAGESHVTWESCSQGEHVGGAVFIKIMGAKDYPDDLNVFLERHECIVYEPNESGIADFFSATGISAKLWGRDDVPLTDFVFIDRVHWWSLDQLTDCVHRHSITPKRGLMTILLMGNPNMAPLAGRYGVGGNVFRALLDMKRWPSIGGVINCPYQRALSNSVWPPFRKYSEGQPPPPPEQLQMRLTPALPVDFFRGGTLLASTTGELKAHIPKTFRRNQDAIVVPSPGDVAVFTAILERDILEETGADEFSLYKGRVSLRLRNGTVLPDPVSPIPITHAGRQLIATLRRHFDPGTPVVLRLGPQTTRRDIYVAAALCDGPGDLRLLGTQADYVQAMCRLPKALGTTSVLTCITE